MENTWLHGLSKRQGLTPAFQAAFQGVCRDNPNKECLGKDKEGPIPLGNYKMNPDNRPNHEKFWRLEPNPSVAGWQYKLGLKRNGFMLHPGSVSWGCITIYSRNTELMQRYQSIHNFLRSEGSNTMTVVP
jgi:Protein of unknown function (DUF2778)